ncbi:MAG: anti-sigma factor [Mesorhizobium sp.]
MTGDNSPITESDLHAYADGTLAPDRRAEIERHLAANPLLADDVAHWRKQNETLRALYAHIAREVPPARLSPYRIAQRLKAQAAGRWRMAAAAAMLVAFGGLAGWFARDMGMAARPGPSLVSEAFAAHSLYTREVLHPVEVGGDQQAHLAAWLSKRLDRPLTIPDLRSAGLTLVGGRLLPANGEPAAQFMYQDDGGRRITLFIIPVRNGKETSMRYTAAENLESFSWSDETVSCALVGDLPKDRLQDIAMRAYKQLG